MRELDGLKPVEPLALIEHFEARLLGFEVQTTVTNSQNN